MKVGRNLIAPIQRQQPCVLAFTIALGVAKIRVSEIKQTVFKNGDGDPNGVYAFLALVLIYYAIRAPM